MSDAGMPHLAVSVTERGSRSFYFQARIRGRLVKVLLGRWPAITVQQARHACQQMNAAMAEGHDPRARRWAADRQITLGRAWSIYLEEHARIRKRSWSSDECRWNKHLKAWESRPLESIGRADVVRLHAAIGQRRRGRDKHAMRTTANRVVALLSAICSFAIRTEMFAGPNPVAGVHRFPEESRARFLTAAELPRFWAAVKNQGAPWRDFFQLALWTGARSGNLQAMRWSQVDLAGGVWTIPAEGAKAGRALRVYLPPAAVEILQRRRSAVGQSEFVFPARTSSGHVGQPRAAWRRLCRRADLTDLRIHDLRRTLGSWQAATGASLHVIGKTLGHSQPVTTAIYARLEMEPVKRAVDAARAAMQAVGQKVENAG